MKTSIPRKARNVSYAGVAGTIPWACKRIVRALDEEAALLLRAPIRTLAQMSEEEILALEARYGCPVKRPKPEGDES